MRSALTRPVVGGRKPLNGGGAIGEDQVPLSGPPAGCGRPLTRPCIGLALGSGSARGWSHIGVIEALEAAGIRPDLVCGSSIGALIGAAHVAGRLEPLKAWADRITWREIVGLLDVRFARGGLIEGRRIVRFLDQLGISAPIESYSTPFAAVATDLRTGEEVWLQTGPIDIAVRASIGLPGILSPTAVGDTWLMDGGLVDPVPVAACRAMGADMVIAVNLNENRLGRRKDRVAMRERAQGRRRVPKEMLGRLLEQMPFAVRAQASLIAGRLLQRGPGSPSYFDVLANAIHIMQDQITRARLAEEPPDVVLVPQLRHVGLLEFHRAREAIAAGRAAVDETRPELESVLAAAHA